MSHEPEFTITQILQDGITRERERLATISLARLCPHRALFCLTVREPLDPTEGNKSMIFRAYASKNPGVWGWPQGALVAQRQINGNRKFTIFAIQLLPRIKTVADPWVPRNNDSPQVSP